MPRLKSKNQELYCYARVYNGLGKSAALRFAGYQDKGKNFYLEDRSYMQARIQEMRETPKEKIYTGEFKKDVDVAEQMIKIQMGTNIDRKWFLEELYKNVELARDAGKIKEATEALKAMAVVFKTLASASPEDPQKAVDHRITRLIEQADAHSNRAKEIEISSEPESSAGLGESAGDDGEDEPDFDISGPEES